MYIGSDELQVNAAWVLRYTLIKPWIYQLLSAADTAMYQAKRQGGDRFMIYESHMSEEVSRIMALESDIEKVFQMGNLNSTYNLCDSHTREMVSAEALLRWRHPERAK